MQCVWPSSICTTILSLNTMYYYIACIIIISAQIDFLCAERGSLICMCENAQSIHIFLGHVKVGIFLRGIIVQFESDSARLLCCVYGAVGESNKLVRKNSDRSTKFTRRCYTVEDMIYCKRIQFNNLKQIYVQVFSKNESRFALCIQIIDSSTASSIIQAPYVSIYPSVYVIRSYHCLLSFTLLYGSLSNIFLYRHQINLHIQ